MQLWERTRLLVGDIATSYAFPRTPLWAHLWRHLTIYSVLFLSKSHTGFWHVQPWEHITKEGNRRHLQKVPSDQSPKGKFMEATGSLYKQAKISWIPKLFLLCLQFPWVLVSLPNSLFCTWSVYHVGNRWESLVLTQQCAGTSSPRLDRASHPLLSTVVENLGSETYNDSYKLCLPSPRAFHTLLHPETMQKACS